MNRYIYHVGAADLEFNAWLNGDALGHADRLCSNKEPMFHYQSSLFELEGQHNMHGYTNSLFFFESLDELGLKAWLTVCCSSKQGTILGFLPQHTY